MVESRLHPSRKFALGFGVAIGLVGFIAAGVRRQTALNSDPDVVSTVTQGVEGMWSVATERWNSFMHAPVVFRTQFAIEVLFPLAWIMLACAVGLSYTGKKKA